MWTEFSVYPPFLKIGCPHKFVVLIRRFQGHLKRRLQIIPRVPALSLALIATDVFLLWNWQREAM